MVNYTVLIQLINMIIILHYTYAHAVFDFVINIHEEVAVNNTIQLASTIFNWSVTYNYSIVVI